MLNLEELGLKDNKALMDKFSTRVKEVFANVQNADRQLIVDEVIYGKPNYDPSDREELHEALVHKKTVGVPYYIKARLVDKSTGNTIDKQKLKLGLLPLETDLNTFVVNGSNYSLPIQFRLKAGAYPRVSDAGVAETFHNVDGGLPMRTQIDPKKMSISLKIRQGSVPMIGILDVLGASKQEMIDAMGDEVYRANDKGSRDVMIKRAYKSIFKKPAPSVEVATEELRAYFAKLNTYADVNAVTLGKPHESIDKDYMLDSIRKTIGVIRGEEAPSNRDNLAFKHVMSPIDLFDDSMGRYNKRNVFTYRGKMKLPGAKKVEDVIDRANFDKTVKQFFTTSQVSRFADQTNPVAIASGALMTTLLGEGGIADSSIVTDDAKEVQNSSMGFLDLTHTPECHDNSTMVMTKEGWKWFCDITTSDQLVCYVDGDVCFRHPYRIIAEEYNGEMYGAVSDKVDYLVTPNHRMYCRKPKTSLSDPYPPFQFEYAMDINDSARFIPTGINIMSSHDTCASIHKGDYYTIHYEGMVYCAEVPGGLLYTQRHGMPMWSGNSASGGISLTLSKDTKYENKNLKTKAINVFTGDEVWLSPLQLQNEFLAFPHELEQKGRKWVSPDNEVWGVRNDKVVSVKPHEVRYMLASAAGMFDIASLSTPFLNHNQGNRLLTSAKMATQALSVIGREKPLVDINIDGETYSDMIGKQSAVLSPTNGVVTDITDRHVEIKGTDGKMYKATMFKNTPLNEKNFIDSTVRVRMGDSVKAGDVIADTNFTIDGKYSPGVNLRTAYVPWKGANYNDACVITQSAADKLRSEHIHKINMPLKSDSMLDLNKFMSTSPYAVSPDTEKNYDRDGIIKPGTEVAPGDTLIAALKSHSPKATDIIIQKMKKSARPQYDDDSLDWKKLSKGTVTDVHKGPSGITVYVKTSEPFRVGDKVTGRHGNKMIVADIIPDELAPVTESGDKIDILIDSMSVPSRINVGQLLETAAGKIAEKTGKQYVVNTFDKSRDYRTEILDSMKKLNIKEKENIYDPETGKTIPDVFTGTQYIYKLKHQVEAKQSSRGIDSSYTIDDTPTRGKGQGGMTIDNLTGNVLLAHGARDFIRESMSIKNNRNADYWNAIINGELPQAPKGTREWDKFMALMSGMGVNVRKNGTKLKLSPLTDADVRGISQGKISDPSKMFKARGENIEPDKNGLFGDTAGSVHGKHYTHIELADRIVNPTYKDAVKTMLNLTEQEYTEMLEK